MDLWINIAKDSLTRLLGRVDMLILNDGEARQFTGETNLVKAARAIRALGPKYVAIKKGEHGCLLFGSEGEFFSCPAYPLEDIHDPTGAGDSFAGGLAGVLARESDSGPVEFGALRRAVVFGSVLASFNVEAFSLERLKTVDAAQIEDRSRLLRLMSQFEAD